MPCSFQINIKTYDGLRILTDLSFISEGSFAIALIYVSYAYTGWNAATYLAGEVEDVQKEMPRVLITGTLVVGLLYILLHFVFLTVAPMSAMARKVRDWSCCCILCFWRAGWSMVFCHVICFVNFDCERDDFIWSEDLASDRTRFSLAVVSR